MSTTACGKKTFMYFAYGSNLLRERILINNPSAVLRTIGKLKDHRLTFDGPLSQYWGGCAATVRRAPGQEVWGAVWEMAHEHMVTLDRQEGVEKELYKPLEVTVETPEQGDLSCRTYEMVRAPGEDCPSCLYKTVIVRGAGECGLPQDYVDKLKDIKDNGVKDNVGACADLKLE